jgi:hypothetical protein
MIRLLKQLFVFKKPSPKHRVFWVAFPAQVETEAEKNEIILDIVTQLQTKITIK